MLSGDEIPQDCLSWEEGELPRKEPKKRVSRRSVLVEPGNKKRRMLEELLTATDIPTIVKSLLEALPGPLMGRTGLGDRSRTGEEVGTAVTNADALASRDNQTVSLSSGIANQFIVMQNNWHGF